MAYFSIVSDNLSRAIPLKTFVPNERIPSLEDFFFFPNLYFFYEKEDEECEEKRIK